MSTFVGLPTMITVPYIEVMILILSLKNSKTVAGNAQKYSTVLNRPITVGTVCQTYGTGLELKYKFTTRLLFEK